MQNTYGRLSDWILPVLAFAACLGVMAAAKGAEFITLVPEVVPCAVADQQEMVIPDRVQLTGWVGHRVEANARNRLAAIDIARLLEGYQKRPGRQTWDGEHIGKWLHAATLAWAQTGDPALRAKLDEAAAALCLCQLDDGYLGTYLPAERWTEWDVWAHKYNLIGLITYMRYTGNMAPLPTCRRMADLVCRDFGDGPGQRDIITSGSHMGMAATSVLEPMVLLYRLTGEPRYLEFCHYLTRAWEQENGPQIVSRLLAGKGVHQVGNAKAYEMLSCLNGALELYRTTGDRELLDASLLAWQDIVDNRLYPTGGASHHELFQDDYVLPNVKKVGETCVTVTWLQFNLQLLRLLGEARFADQIEHVTLNQLFGAQQPDGAGWGYYVEMEGKKPYSATLDGHCCLSSGPRGVALLPTLAVTTDDQGVVVNLFEPGTIDLMLRDGTPVTVTIETVFPTDGHVRIVVAPKVQSEFAMKVRVPGWCNSVEFTPAEGREDVRGYATFRKVWQAGDSIDVDLKLEPRVLVGDHMNQGKAALMYGPLVLAAEEGLSKEKNIPLESLALAGTEADALEITAEPAAKARKYWPGAQTFRVNVVNQKEHATSQVQFLPFADVGSTGSHYKVWVPLSEQGGRD
jgi:DUF1680 family protein